MALGVALLYLGYSPNTTSPSEIATARDFLIAHGKQIAIYAPETGEELLAAGEVDLAFDYSGDILGLMSEDPDIRYLIPDEGSIIWTDSMCIPAGSPNKELAESFINYILDAQVGATLSNYTRYSSPNTAALPYVSEADRNNPALYPQADLRQRLFYITDVGPEATQLYDQAWSEVLAAHEK
jgi:spermidine/putrescine transport system substrate-binding protein